MPVDPTEHDLAVVVHLGLVQQRERTHTGERELPRQRLYIVVEVDQHALAKARFNEAVGVAIELGPHRPAVDVIEEVVEQNLRLEVRHRAGLGAGQIGGVTDHEDVVIIACFQRLGVGVHEVELVPQLAALDALGTHVSGD